MEFVEWLGASSACRRWAQPPSGWALDLSPGGQSLNLVSRKAGERVGGIVKGARSDHGRRYPSPGITVSPPDVTRHPPFEFASDWGAQAGMRHRRTKSFRRQNPSGTCAGYALAGMRNP